MTTPAGYRPRRSCLYMPGANTRALEKATSLPADVLILDLEDAVAPDAKALARETVSRALGASAYGHREVIVRINGLATPWGEPDLEMALASPADGILVPKVSSGDEVRQLDRLLTQAGAGSDLGLWVMIEMPAAILNIADIARAAQNTRLSGLVIGTNDLAKELGAVATPDRAAFQVPLALTLAAARAHGLVAIDGVFNDFRNESGFEHEAEQGRVIGFDGKSLIHPAQLDAANRIFSPDPAAVERAQAVIEAFARPENQGKGVISVAGEMVEILHLHQAERLVAVSRAIARLVEER